MTTAINLFDSSLGCFMKGMLLHDLAKPFFLGSIRHAPAGFFLLTGAGKPTEALYALFHHANTIGLEKTTKFFLDWHGLNHEGDSLEVPAWIFLSPWLDQLAASTYSGVTRDPQNPIWSFQNPFSRLPRLEKVKTYGKPLDNLGTTQKNLWQDVGLDQVCGWDVMKGIVDNFTEPNKQSEMLTYLVNQAQILRDYVRQHAYLLPASLFPERTYPSANDTALREHGQLTAALALVVGGNIILQNTGFSRIMTLNKVGTIINVDGQAAASFDWNRHKEAVLQNLNAWLIRISFHWYENLFHEAIRLDDLHGVKNFLSDPREKRLMELFKEGFHREIGAWFGEDNQVASALQPLNDFPFDLVYLLPGAVSENKIKESVNKAYLKAVAILSGRLKGEYTQDFKDISEIPQLNDQLLAQLQAFVPICYCERIIVQEGSSNDTNQWLKEAKQSLSEQGLEAYSHLWQAGMISKDEACRTISAIPAPERESCEVCGLHGVFKDFYNHYEELVRLGDDRHKIMEKVIYGHKEEPEKLCQACLGRRLWSHGAVQEQWLRDMLEPEEQNNKVVVRLKAETALAPPPKLLPRLEIDKGKKLPEDMGAAFVRWPNDYLQVYPTLAAAADADNNLALLYLTPNWQQGILGEFSQWRATVEALQCIFPLINKWTKSHDWVEENITEWQEMIQAGSGRLVGAKNQCLNKLGYLIDWPNNLSWHPLHHMADLIRRLDTLDPTKDAKKVKHTLSDIIQCWHSFFSSYCEAGGCDLARLEAALVAYVAGLTPQDVNDRFREEALTARPHLARVLTRIRWIDEFFQDVPKLLVDEGCIRTLTLESSYPRLVVVVPAADLFRVLQVLHQSLAHDLFSSTLYEDAPSFPSGPPDEAERRREKFSLDLLFQILPSVLRGAVVIFKERQPLYHLLASARQVIEHLKKQRPFYPGILLGLTDWRRGLGAMAEDQTGGVISLDFCELYYILRNEGLIARRPLTSLAQAAVGDWGDFPDFMQALLAIKQTRQKWPDRVRDVLAQENLFKAMGFLKTAAKG
jgi:hypothetical protein